MGQMGLISQKCCVCVGPHGTAPSLSPLLSLSLSLSHSLTLSTVTLLCTVVLCFFLTHTGLLPLFFLSLFFTERTFYTFLKKPVCGCALVSIKLAFVKWDSRIFFKAHRHDHPMIP